MSDFIISGAKIPVQKVTFLITEEVLLKSFAVSGLNLKYHFHTEVQKYIQQVNRNMLVPEEFKPRTSITGT